MLSIHILLFLAAATFLISSNALRDSNQKLKACCARQKTADKDCKRRFCDFNIINQDNMLHFLNTCTPRNETTRLMWDCASSRADHTTCCKSKNVLPACMPYCETTHGVPADYLNHLICLQNFNVIRDCFRSHLDTHPNIFGDH